MPISTVARGDQPNWGKPMSSTDQAFFAGAFLVIFLVAISSLITGLIGYAVAASKGRGGLGFILGFFLSIIGIIIAAVIEPSPEEQRRRSMGSAGFNPMYGAPMPTMPIAPTMPAVPVSNPAMQAAPGSSGTSGTCASCGQYLSAPLCSRCGWMNRVPAS